MAAINATTVHDRISQAWSERDTAEMLTVLRFCAQLLLATVQFTCLPRTEKYEKINYNLYIQDRIEVKNSFSYPK